MRVLITGGAGFIGHHVIRGALERGDDVCVLDDFSSGYRSRLTAFRGAIKVVEGSLLDEVALHGALAGSDVVLHLAAVASVAQSVAKPRWTNEVNVGGTIDLMLAAALQGVRRIVIASSSAVYGNSAAPFLREDLVPNPQSPYGASKLAGEHFLHSIGRLHGLETIALRYFNVFGPGQDPASEYSAVVPRFVSAVVEGRQPVIFGSGDISRDFVYVDNVVQANLLAMSLGGPTGATYNIGSGTRTTLLQLLAAITEAAGRSTDPAFGPAREGDVLHSLADISRVERELGYRVGMPFAEGIARTVEWYRSSPPPLSNS